MNVTVWLDTVPKSVSNRFAQQFPILYASIWKKKMFTKIILESLMVSERRSTIRRKALWGTSAMATVPIVHMAMAGH